MGLLRWFLISPEQTMEINDGDTGIVEKSLIEHIC